MMTTTIIISHQVDMEQNETVSFQLRNSNCSLFLHTHWYTVKSVRQLIVVINVVIILISFINKLESKERIVVLMIESDGVRERESVYTLVYFIVNSVV